MQIRFLGVHQGESKHTRFLSLVVDGILALDAGSLTSSLTFAEQQQLRAILLTHHHYDHVKDIPVIGFNGLHTDQIAIYGLAETRAAVQAYLLNSDIWLNLHELPADRPALHFIDVQPGVE